MSRSRADQRWKAGRSKGVARGGKPAGEAVLGRHVTVVVLFLAAVAALSVRITYLHITERDFLRDQGDARSVHREVLNAHRGQILDRRGEPLAISAPVDALWIDPRRTALTPAQLGVLATTLGVPEPKLADTVSRGEGRAFLYLARGLQAVEVRAVKSLAIPGLRFQREYRRYYPAGEAAAHLVGLTDIDDAGLEGIELAYDDLLKGIPGSKEVLRDRKGQPIRDVTVRQAARMGRDLTLSVDLRLQYFAHQELKAALARHGADSASMVVLDARTAEVLALVNAPSYNPNSRSHADFARMRNRAVTDRYEPGSTIKPFAVVAALASGRFDVTSQIDTAPGYMNVGGKLVEDPVNRGVLDLEGVLKHSSQVGIAKLALALPERAVFEALMDAGLGAPVGSGLPGETAARLSDRGLHRELARVTLAYGYGLAVTPLQLAQGYLALATGGLEAPVTVLRRSQPPPVRRVLPAAAVRSVRSLMQAVTEPDGTAPEAAIAGTTVAGKTGTARKVGSEGYDDERHVALFAGMAPAQAPRFVAVVVINEPRGRLKGGGAVAAPVFSRVIDRALRLVPAPEQRYSSVPGTGKEANDAA